MIGAKGLRGRAVMDLDRGEEIGRVDEVVLDPGARRLAGLVVSSGLPLVGEARHTFVAAADIHAIGPDAITVRGPAGEGPEAAGALPRLSQLLGRRIVTREGAALGALADVLLDDAAGRIRGYVIGAPAGASAWDARLGEALGRGRRRGRGYVRADADVRVGADAMVVPAEAVVRARPTGAASPEGGRGGRPPGAPDGARGGPPRAVGGGRRRVATPEAARAAAMDAAIREAKAAARAKRAAAATAERWEDALARHRADWEQRYEGTGGRWERYEPRYRFGWERAHLAEYRGRPWPEVEPDLRREWEARYRDAPWDEAGGAVRAAWERAHGA